MFSSPLIPLFVSLALLVMARRHLAGTTLLAPWAWAVAVVGFWFTVELWNATSVVPTALRYLTLAGTLCPMMALMGAKRPQDRGWQWIVLSLWCVLAIPVGQHFMFTPSQPFALFAAWPIFLFVLIGLELLNYLPTRYAPSAMLFVVAQSILVAEVLDWFETPLTSSAAAWLTFVAIAVAWLFSPQSPAPNPQPPTSRWLHFRNTFGAFWALRILQRVNQTAEIQDWPVRLEWSGFRELPGRSDPLPEEAVEKCLDTLLRRFGS